MGLRGGHVFGALALELRSKGSLPLDPRGERAVSDFWDHLVVGLNYSS